MQKFFDPYLEVEINQVDKVNPEKFTLTQASSYRAALGTKEWDNLFTFAIVRNPYDRCVSVWQMLEPKQNFRFFIEKISKLEIETLRIYDNLTYHCCLQSPHLTDGNGNIIVDCICRFENLEEDFNKITKIIGIQNSKLPHVKRTFHKHYSKYYDEATKIMVTEIYKKDIETFNYKFERQNLIDSIIDELQFALYNLYLHVRWQANDVALNKLREPSKAYSKYLKFIDFIQRK